MVSLSDIDWTAFGNIIPSEIFLWGKIASIVIGVYFVTLIIRNIIQMINSLQLRKISKNVQQINIKLDQLVIPQEADEYNESAYEEDPR